MITEPSISSHPDIPWLQPRAAYLHIPFCAHHCNYCDFAVVAGQDHQMDLYLEALGEELAGLKQPRPVRTLFLGGGTPTYLNPRQLQNLLVLIARWLPLEPGGELSIEANPAGLTADKVEVLAGHGVNRISLGVQSLHPHLLQVLERDHVPEDVIRAVAAVKSCLANFSLDLIFGVPGQTLEQWEEDLSQALALEPTHLSTYGLTFEKGTRLWKQKESGQWHPLDEDLELAMYCLAMDRLESAGFEHYEISNFARPGRRCRHNQVYWANHAYFGFGLGAARYIDGCRQLNSRNLDTYLRQALAGEVPVFQSETLSPRERALETITTQFRRAEGIRRMEFRQQTGFDVDALAGPILPNHQALGLIQDDGAGISLTRRGKCVADAVVREYLGL